MQINYLCPCNCAGAPVQQLGRSRPSRPMRFAWTVRSARIHRLKQPLQQKRTVLLRPCTNRHKKKNRELDPPRLTVPDLRRRWLDPPVIRSLRPNHVDEELPHLSSRLGIASIMSYIRHDLLAAMDLGSSSVTAGRGCSSPRARSSSPATGCSMHPCPPCWISPPEFTETRAGSQLSHDGCSKTLCRL